MMTNLITEIIQCVFLSILIGGIFTWPAPALSPLVIAPLLIGSVSLVVIGSGALALLCNGVIYIMLFLTFAYLLLIFLGKFEYKPGIKRIVSGTLGFSIVLFILVNFLNTGLDSSIGDTLHFSGPSVWLLKYTQYMNQPEVSDWTFIKGNLLYGLIMILVIEGLGFAVSRIAISKRSSR